MEELEEGVKELKGIATNPIGRATMSISLGPLELPETKPKKQGAYMYICSTSIYVLEDCLVLLQWERMRLILWKLDASVGRDAGEGKERMGKIGRAHV